MTLTSNPFRERRVSLQGDSTRVSSTTTVVDPSAIRQPSSHHHHSRRTSHASAAECSGVVLSDKDLPVEDPDHLQHQGRRGSANATFEEGVVMESGLRGYLVVFGGFLIIVAVIGYVSIYGLFQAKYNDIYGPQGHSQSSISFIGSLASGFQFGFTIIVGPIMNRFGHKITLWAGCILGSLGLLLASWCSQIWQLYLTQGIIFGIGASFLNLAATAIPPLWYDKHRGLAMGICFCGAGIGGLVLGFVIPALINAVDIYWTLRIYAIFHFVCTAFAALVMRAPRQLAGPPIKTEKDVMNWAIMKDPGFMLWFTAAILFGFAYVVPFTYVPSYAKDVIGLDPNVQGGQLLAIMSAANAVGRIVIGFAGDRLGAIPVAASAFIVAGASCFIWMFAESEGALIGFSVVYGFVSGAFFTMIASITANIVGLANLGSGLTVIYLTNTPGNLFTLPIAGKIFEQAGDYKAMIGYNAAMYLGGGIVLFFLMFYNRHSPV
ncbi:major facilitator superfamily domain-containing protein [Dissophora ornata]|nr:hypothetical protein BGZ58_007492 [Dissophora ornata]KAI8598298.1 major facilitator superfamily domain-containing protein [Dissophora ornata]